MAGKAEATRAPFPGALGRVAVFLEAIKFEHSVFALPFAVLAAFLVSDGVPSWRPLLWVVVAMVGARTFGMAANRLIDAEIDARNPRTAGRAIPAGLLKKRDVVLFMALAAVAFGIAVSRLDRLAWYLSGARGVRAAAEYGGAVRVEPAGVPAGTTFTVRDLFRNTPARLKFLGSAATELNRTHQVVATYALTRPEVAFSLVADGQAKFSTPGRGDLVEAVAGVYGWHVAREMLRVDPPRVVRPDHGGFGVAGLVGTPGLTRGNRGYITISVNGRWVESRRLSFAVEQAYHGFLAERRFPVAVLHLTVPPGDVDVNVHPAKSEVRFLREQVVFAEVQRAVRAALVESAPVPHVQQASGHGGAPATAWPVNPLWPPAYAGGGTEPPPSGQPPSGQPLAGQPPSERGDAYLLAGRPQQPTPRRSLPVLRVIGQAHDTYIVAEGPNGVYLVDQHAAHERVVFEEIRERLGKPSEGGQRLLSPETVQLLPDHERILQEHGELLSETGFEVEPFGPHTALVRAVPRVLPGGSGAEALVRLLDSLADGTGTAVWRERVLATLACHAAVRAGRRLTSDESQELIRRLETVEQPHTCPHGRPTMIYLSVSALERDFSRR